MAKVNPSLLTANSATFIITPLDKGQGEPPKITILTLASATKGSTTLSVTISVPSGINPSTVTILNGTYFIVSNQIIVLDGDVTGSATSLKIDPLTADLPINSLFYTYVNSVPVLGLESANLQLQKEVNQVVLLRSKGWANKDYSTGTWQFSGNMMIPVNPLFVTGSQKILDALLTEKLVWCERILSNGRYMAGRAVVTDCSDTVSGNAYVSVNLTLQGSGKILNKIIDSVVVNNSPITVDPNLTGYDIVLAIGQSNMVGVNSGDYNASIDTTDTRAQQRPPSGIQASTNILLENPVSFTEKQAAGTISLVTSFARKYIEANKLTAQRKLLILPLAIGATGFGDNRWNPGNDLYNRAVNFTNLVIAEEGNNLVAILWHQGENDSFNPMAKATYITKLDAMITGLRNAIYDAVNVPFILGEMGREWVGNTANYLSTQSAIQETPNRQPKTAVATSWGLPGNSNELIHFQGKSCRLLGERYLKNFNKIVDSNQSVTKPNETLNTSNDHFRLKLDFNFLDTAQYSISTTPTNVSIVFDSIRGNVCQFQSPDSAIKLNSGIGSTYTKTLWVKFNQLTAGQNLISGVASFGESINVFWSPEEGKLAVGHGQDSATLTTPFLSNLVQNQWIHLACTNQGSEIKIFVNGVKVAQRTNAPNYPGGGAGAEMKVGNFYQTEPTKGFISDARLYWEALSESQIQQIYLGTLIE